MYGITLNNPLFSYEKIKHTFLTRPENQGHCWVTLGCHSHSSSLSWWSYSTTWLLSKLIHTPTIILFSWETMRGRLAFIQIHHSTNMREMFLDGPENQAHVWETLGWNIMGYLACRCRQLLSDLIILQSADPNTLLLCCEGGTHSQLDLKNRIMAQWLWVRCWWSSKAVGTW